MNATRAELFLWPVVLLAFGAAIGFAVGGAYVYAKAPALRAVAEAERITREAAGP